MDEEKADQGFTVKDRRIFAPDRQEKAEEEKPAQTVEAKPQPEERAKEKPKGDKGTQMPLPEPTFSSFLTFFFFQQALMFIGEIPHPETQQVEKNLPMAKYLIDTLAIIKEKTRGNLSPDEQSQLDNFLTELRMRYVSVVGK